MTERKLYDIMLARYQQSLAFWEKKLEATPLYQPELRICCQKQILTISKAITNTERRIKVYESSEDVQNVALLRTA